MSELLVLNEIFSSVKDGAIINLRTLHARLEESVLAPYIGDVESIKQLIFRLNQESVMYASIHGDEVHVEHVEEESPLHKNVELLIAIIKSSDDVGSFKKNVSTSAINRYFMD
nr:hypothetical protein [Candidatus Sigynarchaeota archaeon]